MSHSPTASVCQLAPESVPTCAPAYCNQFLYFVYPCVYPNAKRVMEIFHNPLIYLVGAKGFEPSTPCSQSRCATKLRHAPQECAVANAGAESVGETNCCLPSRRGVCPDMTTICLKVVPIKRIFCAGLLRCRFNHFAMPRVKPCLGFRWGVRAGYFCPSGC